MDIEIKSWLFDILNAINEIDSFFTDIPQDFLYFKNDIKTKRAVERNVEIAVTRSLILTEIDNKGYTM
jgi:hypothetical protein